jgi:hypothetical protein
MDVVGGGRSRTADLIHVMDALFYLSYPPLLKEKPGSDLFCRA